MDKVWAIIKREYLSRVRSKGFVIGTILSPLLMISFIIVPVLIARYSGRDSYRLAVLDQSGDPEFITRLDQLLTGKNELGERLEVKYEVVPAGENPETRRAELNRQMADGAIAGYLVVPRGVTEAEKVALHTKSVSDFTLRGRVSDALNDAVFERRLTQAGFDAGKIREMGRDVRIEMINERGERERGQTFILAYGLLMILYITILIYGVTMMRGVIEEKQSRIVEVLLSSVRPFQLMLGKLVGIGLVGLTQYTVWAVTALLISFLAAAPALALGGNRLPKLPATVLVFFVVYFILGYFLFATLYAMVGAMVSSEEDGQQLQMPVTMAIVIPMIVSSVVLRNPDGMTSTILSLIPLFSPVLMFMRICIQQPPWWQIALSIILLIGTILGAVWVAAKIYRVGILMYGKRPSLPEVVRWLKYT
jgi:ABC-2 type transport system permease protein